MKINSVNKINYGAGNVVLKRINEESLASYKAIKKIAEDKGIDVFIAKGKDSKYLPKENMYVVIASKELPHTETNSLTNEKRIRGVEIETMNKITGGETFSVRIYNATMKAIDVLEEKLGVKG